MRIVVHRHGPKGDATMGTLAIDGVPQCFTLEDLVREVPGQPVSAWKVFGKTAIPRGTYAVKITASARFQRRLPLLLDVPGFEGVRIHPGNTAADTEGCILVGYDDLGDGRIGRSRAAFDVLYAKIESALARGEAVSLTVQ